MSIIRINHVQICIPKGAEKEGRQFYCGLLGLPEIEKPVSLQERGGFWLQVGDQQLHVGTEEDVDRASTKAHLSYEVDDLEAWRERLQKNGTVILDSVPIPGYDRFEFRDPFGNRVEFMHPLL